MSLRYPPSLGKTQRRHSVVFKYILIFAFSLSLYSIQNLALTVTNALNKELFNLLQSIRSYAYTSILTYLFITLCTLVHSRI